MECISRGIPAGGKPLCCISMSFRKSRFHAAKSVGSSFLSGVRHRSIDLSGFFDFLPLDPFLASPFFPFSWPSPLPPFPPPKSFLSLSPFHAPWLFPTPPRSWGAGAPVLGIPSLLQFPPSLWPMKLLFFPFWSLALPLLSRLSLKEEDVTFTFEASDLSLQFPFVSLQLLSELYLSPPDVVAVAVPL